MTETRPPARRLFGYGVLAAAALAAAGCTAGNPQLTGAAVSGVVRAKGRPVTGGSLRLIDPADPNKSTSGQILGDGTYKVLNAPVGEVVVVVETASAKADPRAFIALAKAKGGKVDESILPPGPPLKYVPIDPKYSDPAKSPLRITVEKGEHTKDIELP